VGILLEVIGGLALVCVLIAALQGVAIAWVALALTLAAFLVARWRE